jgi:hypothetical protein
MNIPTRVRAIMPFIFIVASFTIHIAQIWVVMIALYVFTSLETPA